MPDQIPIILERVAGTPGSPDATGRIRRVTSAELAAYGAAANDWLPFESVLARGAGAVAGLVLPPLSVVGRAGTGSVRALTSVDLDAILGLSTLIGGRAPAIHGHAISEIANLQTILNGVSRVGHTHPVTDLTSSGVPTGYVVTKTAGGPVAWQAPTGGGGATLAGPLVGDIEMGTFRILGCSPSVEFFRCTGGRLIVQGGRLPILNEGTPATGHVWIWNGTTWVHRVLVAADITATALTGVPGTTVHAQLAELLALIDARALLSHTHALADVLVPGGATVGQVVSVAADGTFVCTTPSGGGGGIANPLTANLDLSTYALMSGVTEILKYSGGQVILGGRAVFPAAIVTPAAGHIPIYNPGTTLFENGLPQAQYVSMSAIGGVTTTSVQAAIASLKTQLTAATLETSDDLPEGATNKYVNGANLSAAGAVMVSALATSTSLGTSDVLAPSQNAVKVYVDTAIAGVGGGGIPVGTSFPGAPDDEDVFLRSDLKETFIYVDGKSWWVSLSERSVSFSLEDYAPADTVGSTSAPGAYIFGNGNTLGYRLPWDAVITAATVQSTVVDTGTVTVRTAPYGGSVTDALTLAFTADAGATTIDPDGISADEGELISVHAKNFGDGIIGAAMTLFYRRRIDV